MADLLDLVASLWPSTLDTLYMVGVSSVLAALFGLPVGVALATTESGGLFPAPAFNRVLGAIVNAGRSLPFIILLVAVTPLTRIIAGTSIGSTAAIVPLTLAAIPFFGRVVETSLREVDRGLVEAALAMGCNSWQIIGKVLVPEAVPSLILGAAIMVISLVGYSAMAGAIGGGGLGDLAIRYGYQRFQANVMLATIVVLIALVQLIQWLGDRLAAQFRRR